MKSTQKILALIIFVILLPGTFSSAVGAEERLQITAGTNTVGAPYFCDDAPYVVENGRVDGRTGAYGKFGFTRVPEEDRLYDTINGNCLSYALRDSVPVHLGDLGGSYDDINRVFLESGKDGVVLYIGELFEKYV